MKKIVLALDGARGIHRIGPRSRHGAPRLFQGLMPMPVAPSWTGFAILGGAGGGLWAGDQHTQTTVGAILRD